MFSPPGLIRFWPNSMLTRLKSRTGAKVRIATATASCAETAALIGAWSLAERACCMRTFGSETTSLQTPSVSTCRTNCKFFGVKPSSAMLFQSRSHLVETVKCGLVQATCLAGHSQQFPAEVDGGGLRLIAILLPIGVDDPFDDIGVEERGQ